MHFNNFRVGTRLAIGFTVLLLLLALMMAISI